jgi:hypothetical protein
MSVPVNASIVEPFQTFKDPRSERTKKHNLLDILVIALCTLLTGGEGFQDMELFGKSQLAWLQTFLALPPGIPSHDTFGRVFARLTPQRFQACFLAWTQAVAQLTKGALVSRVPGMFMYLEGASPSANLMEVKGSEAQGRHREVGSEGSVEQKCEPTNRNWIRGAPVGRVRVRARSPYPSRTTGVNPAVVH